MNKSISILMPIYNGIEFIEESISTIKYQTYKNWELIIGINGYDANSAVYEIAKKYESINNTNNTNNTINKIRVYDLVGIKGKSNALNKMLEYCNYDWIALLDVDDKWLPKKLESQMPYMNEYDVIATQCKYFGDSTTIPYIPPGDITANNFNFLQSNPIINSSVLLKKELCYWDENWDGVEDYDLWLKLWQQSKKFYNVKGVQVMHRIHRASAFNANGNNLKVKDLLNKYQPLAMSLYRR